MNLKQAMEVERALAACEHPYTAALYSFGRWCNVCGAIKLAADSDWTVPHWRDRLRGLVLEPPVVLGKDLHRCDSCGAEGNVLCNRYTCQSVTCQCPTCVFRRRKIRE